MPRHPAIKKMICQFLASILILTLSLNPAWARGAVRDAEIEQLLRDYANPVFRAAGLSPKYIQVNLVAQDQINAFVTHGQRMFIFTGLLLESDHPSEIIGVIAHETGHIAKGHLVDLERKIGKLAPLNIIGLLLGGAAVAAGGGSAGVGAATAGQAIAQRSLLSYRRAQEATADQAAIRYLNKAGITPKGMVSLFEKLADQTLVSLRNVDPYVLSHPMPQERINLLTKKVKESPVYNRPVPASFIKRHKMMQAKLWGFLRPIQSVFKRYPKKDKSDEALYARSISYYRNADLDSALSELKILLGRYPKNPYLWELQGQILFESGRIRQAIAPLQRSVALAPKQALFRMLLADALVATENPASANEAIKHLTYARRTEQYSSSLHRIMSRAYGIKRDEGRASLHSAYSAFFKGDVVTARQLAFRAKRILKKNTPEWRQAVDLSEYKKRGK